VVLMTLLVPEWILAWAVRQFLGAWKYGRMLENARQDCEKARKELEEEGKELEEEGKEPEEEGKELEEERRRPERLRKTLEKARLELEGQRDTTVTVTDKSTPSEWDKEAALGRTDQPWTTTHGFFVIMGGFHFYSDGEPVHALHFDDVLELVQDGELVPPTLTELKDRSKGNSLSKTIVIFQTLCSRS